MGGCPQAFVICWCFKPFKLPSVSYAWVPEVGCAARWLVRSLSELFVPSLDQYDCSQVHFVSSHRQLDCSRARIWPVIFGGCVFGL